MAGRAIGVCGLICGRGVAIWGLPAGIDGRAAGIEGRAAPPPTRPIEGRAAPPPARPIEGRPPPPPPGRASATAAISRTTIAIDVRAAGCRIG
jgi:hypothetical protein